LKCNTCGHRVLLSRRDFERRLKMVIHPVEQTKDSKAED
jgi:hypothetical protein